jgi:hypothetical protein
MLTRFGSKKNHKCGFGASLAISDKRESFVLTYGQLVEKLATVGVTETERNLNN